MSRRRALFGHDDRVYFFLPRPVPKGPIVKIGYTVDVVQRFDAHARNLGGEPIGSIRGGPSLEAAWHKRFQHLRVPVVGSREIYWLTAELDWAITQAVAGSPSSGRNEFLAWRTRRATLAPRERRSRPIGIEQCGCGKLVVPPVLQTRIHYCDGPAPRVWFGDSERPVQ